MKRTYQLGAVTFVFKDGDKARIERTQNMGGNDSNVFEITELHMMMAIEPMCQKVSGIPQVEDKSE